jgi:hypothetical protein
MKTEETVEVRIDNGSPFAIQTGGGTHIGTGQHDWGRTGGMDGKNESCQGKAKKKLFHGEAILEVAAGDATERGICREAPLPRTCRWLF